MKGSPKLYEAACALSALFRGRDHITYTQVLRLSRRSGYSLDTFKKAKKKLFLKSSKIKTPEGFISSWKKTKRFDEARKQLKK